MKNIFKKSVRVCLAAFIVVQSGCSALENETDVPVPEQPTSLPKASLTLQETNRMMEEYARVLAVSMSNPSLRMVIRKEAKRKIDGDYDIPLPKLEAALLTSPNCKVKELLLQNNLKRLRNASALVTAEDTTSTRKSFTDLSGLMPGFQVSVPVLCESWNTDTYVPMVAVVPLDYDEATDTVVLAYDQEGNAHWISTEVEPEVPFVVLGPSERNPEVGPVVEKADPVVASGRLDMPMSPGARAIQTLPAFPQKLLLTHGSARTFLLEWSDVENETSYEVWRMHASAFERIATTAYNDNNYIDAGLTANIKYWYKVRAINGDGYSSWSPVMASTASSRNDNEWLKIARMRFTSSALNAVEKWISGAPEMRLRVVQGCENGASCIYTSGLIKPGSRSQVVDDWWSHEITLFSWNTNVYGTVLTFDWREEDWTDKVEFTINGCYEDKSSNGNIKLGGAVNIKDDEGGDVIGNTSVFWWQDKLQTYDLSGFRWQFVN